MGPVQVGVRSKAQVHHQGDGPGLLGAAIFTAISAKDQWGSRSHPNKAVDVFACQNFSRGLLASALSTHVGSASSSGFPNAVARNGSALVACFLTLAS